MPAIGAGGRRSVSRHTFLAFLGDPPQRLCKGFKGGKQDSPLCALFTSFLWRQRKDVPPRHERWTRWRFFFLQISKIRMDTGFFNLLLLFIRKGFIVALQLFYTLFVVVVSYFQHLSISFYLDEQGIYQLDENGSRFYLESAPEGAPEFYYE